MKNRRVVVTGIGLITPVGHDVATSWQAVCNGRSGISVVDTFDTSNYASRIAGYVRDYDPTQYISAKDAKRFDVFVQYGIGAAAQAFADSGLDTNAIDPTRAGICVGSGIGGLNMIENNHSTLLESGPRRISPFFIPGAIINILAGQIAIMCGLKGPNSSTVTACTTGTHNIGYAARHIDYGEADIMLAGGAEMATCPLGLGGFAALRALSTRNDEPEKASRPFDRDRDGFVLGDGSGVLVLEEYEHAVKRGANIYAELVGFGMSGDAHHITAPGEDGDGAKRCMQAALDDAQVAPTVVDYINAHGTSTKLNDKIETHAIKEVFNNHAYDMCVSSSKSMLGHSLGAAGAIEAAICALSMKHKIVTPTINLDNPDENCDLDYVPHTARERDIQYALSNSFGFGGTNGSLLFKQV